MSDFESKVRIDIDAGQALATIKALQRQISDFHTSLAKGSATANLKSLQMQQSLIDTINATGQYSAQMKTVASSTQAFTTALEKNKLSMGQYFKYAGGASKSFGRFFKTEMDTIQKVAIERVKDLQTQYIKMGRDANGALRSIAVRPLALDMENLATKTQIAAQKQQLLNQLLKQGSTNLLNFGKNTQWAGRQLMVGFTIPLGILGTTAAKTFMDMEKQAISFKRVYGDTFTPSAETDKMLKQVQQLASEFTKYGVTVEKTMEQAAKAAATGKVGADLLAQVSESTRLAVLGNVDQQQALETTISLTNAFGTAADELRGKINFLNAVENQTITSIEDLTTAIPKAAPVIKQLGGNVEDLAFFLTAMREGGINASEGANALKSGLAALINPTTKASKMLEGFGINISSIVQKNQGDVKNLVIDFAKALDTLDPLNRARAIEQLFGKFQFSRLSTLFQNVIKDGSQAARVLELTKQSSAELGILAQRELGRISSSPMYKFQKAIADFKKELAPVGEEFIKAVTPLIQFGTDILKSFNKLDGGVKQFLVNTTGLIAGIGPIFLMTFGLLANGVANIIKGFTFVKNIFNKTSTASTVLGETTDYMTQQQIEAAAVAASLEQVHNKLTQAFTVEAGAVSKLTTAYQRAVAAQVAFTGPAAAGKAAKPKKYADGIFSVPGPKGAGDIVPAMLAPGEAVIPAGPAQKYRGFIKGIIAGKIPGFSIGEENVGGKPKKEKKESRPRNTSSTEGIINMAKSHLRSKPRGVYDKWLASFGSEPWAGYGEEQSAGLRAAEDRMREMGLSEAKIQRNLNNLAKVDLSHLEKQTTRRKIGNKVVDVKSWMHKNLRLDARMFNQYAHALSGKKASFFAGLDIPGIAKELGISQTSVMKEVQGLQAGKHPGKTGYAVMAAIGKRDGSYQGAAVSAAYEVRKNKNAYFKTAEAGTLTPPASTDAAAKAKINATIENANKNLAKLATTQTAQDSGRKPKSRTPKAKQDKAIDKNTQAVNADTAETKKGTKRKRDANKAATKAKVAATPTVTVTETLGNGVTREVDANGKEKFRINGKYANPEKAKALAASTGAATTPKGRIKGLLTGLPGKLGLAGLATMGVGAVTGNQQISSISDQLFQAAMLSSFVPQGAMGKLRGKFAGTGVERIIEKFSLKLAELTPKLIKFGKFFGGPLTLAITAGMMVYDAATADLRKQAEINTAIYNTINTTKDRLEKINEFFGTTAKLSTARTMEMIPVGFNNKKAFSVANEFRKSDQFKAEYQASAQKLAGATNEEVRLALQSLAFDLVASGVGEEQAQAIIDAIKLEAKKTDVVIEVKSLALDTESGFAAAKETVKTSINNFAKEIGSYFNLGGYSISDVMEGRNKGWLESFFGSFTSFNTDNIINQIKQVANALNGVSAAYLNATIDGKQFDNQLQSLADSISGLKPADQVEAYDAILTDLNPVVAELANKINTAAGYGLILKSVLAGITFSPEIINLLADGTQESLDIVTAAYNKAKAAQDAQLQQKKNLQTQQKNLQKQQEKIADNEDAINKKYDDRIRALERIQALNEKISAQQKNQLDLADALSQGDVFGAAQAVQQMRADDAAYALEQQKNVLEDQRRKDLGAQQKAADKIDKQQADIQDQIANISNAVINIDKYLVYPPRTQDNYQSGQGLQDVFAREALKKQGGYTDKQLDFFFGAGKKGNYTGPFGVNGIPSESDFNRMKQAYANYQIYGENADTGTLNAIGVKATAKELSNSGLKKTGWWNWVSKDSSKNTADTLPYSGLYMSGQAVAETIDPSKIKRGMLVKDPSGNTYEIADLISASQSSQYPSLVLVKPQEKAVGGYISGPGSGTSDSIPARLSNGEYVIRANAVKTIGTDVLDKLNYADKNNFASGGIVKSGAQFPEGTAINRDAASWKTPMDYIVDFFGWIGSLFNQPKKIAPTLPKVHKVPLNPTGPSTPRIKKETKQYFGYADGGPVGDTGDYGAGKIPLETIGQKSLFRLSNKQLKSVIGGMYSRKNVKVGDKSYPTYKVPGIKGSITFEGYEQPRSFLSSLGVRSIPTTPEGLLSAALEANPENKNLQIMLENFKQGTIGDPERNFLDRMYAAVSVNKKGKLTSFQNTDGFATFLSSLIGNKDAKNLVDAQTLRLRSTIKMNAIRNTRGSAKSIAEYLDFTKEAGTAVPSTVPVVRSIQGPLEFDKSGNALIYPSSRYRPDFASSTTHFTLEYPVQSHMGGKWDPMASKVFVPLSEMIDANGIPRSMDAGDTYWLPEEGKATILPKGKYSQLHHSNNPAEYAKDLVRRGLLRPGETVPIMTIDPTTKEVLSLLQPDYTDAQKELFYQRFNTMFLPEYDPQKLIEQVGVQEAKKLVGINTPLHTLDESQHLSSELRARQLSRLGRSLGVEGGHTTHSQSIDNTVKKAIHEKDYFSGRTESSSHVSSIDNINLARTLSKQGHFKVQEILPKVAKAFSRFGGALSILGGPELSTLLQGFMLNWDMSFNKPTKEQLDQQKILSTYAKGGLVGIPKFKNGGMFRTPYAGGGLAMLHDKEFVMNPGAVKEYGLNNLKAMNNGTYNNGSVYNSYGVNINVGNSNANANDIAKAVIREIKKIDAQQIRSTKV